MTLHQADSPIAAARPEPGPGSDEPRAQPLRFDLPDADVVLYENFFEPREADELLRVLDATIEWRQESIRLYGKTFDLPRLTAWYGDCAKTYSWSGLTLRPRRWSAELLRIRQRVEQAAQTHFSSVLLNLYRGGRDGVEWHSDDEKELGLNPVIASLSFGATRLFQMRHATRVDLPRVDLLLAHGSLLLMRGPTQHHWRHRIPKTTRDVGRRINLTFRRIG